ncbi:MAG: hypothetical protein HC923_12935, partial [Myxococcales bacterium]|nr:hypothetical protein [Myxococcales bacterium]
LKFLFSNRTRTKSKTTLFVFIRAVILRDDKFEDLKVLSGESAGRADLARDLEAAHALIARLRADLDEALAALRDERKRHR